MNGESAENRFIDLPFSAVIISFFIHLIFPLAFLTVKGLEKLGVHLFPERNIVDKAYQSFIQVDMVALPDLAVNEKNDFDPTLPVVDKPAKDLESDNAKSDDMHFKEEQEKEKAAKKLAEEMALKKEKALEEKRHKAEKEQALKRLRDDAKREQALKALERKSGKEGRSKIAGNLLSSGNATTGAIGTPKDQYTSILVEKIKQHFNVYLWQRKNLEATIEFEMYATGRVKKKHVAKSSGDTTFDSALLKAIDDAQPLPVPSDPLLINEVFSVLFKP